MLTGLDPLPNDEYAVAFSASHVSELAKSHPEFATSKYLRGPSASGFATQGIANNIAIWVQQYTDLMKLLRKENPNVNIPIPEIYLTGYSRGGAAVINACYYLMLLIGQLSAIQILFLIM